MKKARKTGEVFAVWLMVGRILRPLGWFTGGGGEPAGRG